MLGGSLAATSKDGGNYYYYYFIFFRFGERRAKQLFSFCCVVCLLRNFPGRRVRRATCIHS